MMKTRWREKIIANFQTKKKKIIKLLPLLFLSHKFAHSCDFVIVFPLSLSYAYVLSEKRNKGSCMLIWEEKKKKEQIFFLLGGAFSIASSRSFKCRFIISFLWMFYFFLFVNMAISKKISIYLLLFPHINHLKSINNNSSVNLAIL